mmetsp:Transcript_22911/g.26118  ORF Transcript_22911/g.26118 Transcript_22911/m.26118 type:complete len:273 (+) Transcript_22911:462-1280(+)
MIGILLGSNIVANEFIAQSAAINFSSTNPPFFSKFSLEELISSNTRFNFIGLFNSSLSIGICSFSSLSEAKTFSKTNLAFFIKESSCGTVSTTLLTSEDSMKSAKSPNSSSASSVKRTSACMVMEAVSKSSKSTILSLLATSINLRIFSCEDILECANSFESLTVLLSDEYKMFFSLIKTICLVGIAEKSPKFPKSLSCFDASESLDAIFSSSTVSSTVICPKLSKSTSSSLASGSKSSSSPPSILSSLSTLEFNIFASLSKSFSFLFAIDE